MGGGVGSVLITIKHDPFKEAGSDGVGSSCLILTPRQLHKVTSERWWLGWSGVGEVIGHYIYISFKKQHLHTYTPDDDNNKMGGGGGNGGGGGGAKQYEAGFRDDGDGRQHG